MKTKKENVPLLVFLSITYAVVCFVVLWLPLRFFAGCTQKIAEIEKKAAEKPRLTEVERFAVAERITVNGKTIPIPARNSILLSRKWGNIT